MKLDTMQLCLVEQQAELFEELGRRNVDAKAFIKAYMNSKAVEELDLPYDRMQWAGKEYLFQEVMEESGLKPDPNCRRYDAEVLFYGGYITRYWHYLTGESSKEIYRQCNEDQLLASYGLHIESNELAVEDLKRLAHQC